MDIILTMIRPTSPNHPVVPSIKTLIPIKRKAIEAMIGNQIAGIEIVSAKIIC